MDLFQGVPAFQVFRKPGTGIPTDLHDAMDSLCRLVGETSSRTYRISGVLQPAMLLHWKVQAHLVSRLSPASRWTYRKVFGAERIDGRPLSHYGLRGTVDRPDPAPKTEVCSSTVPATREMNSFAAEVSQPGSPLCRNQLGTLRKKTRASSRVMPATPKRYQREARLRAPLSLGNPAVQELERATPTRSTLFPVPEP